MNRQVAEMMGGSKIDDKKEHCKNRINPGKR